MLENKQRDLKLSCDIHLLCIYFQTVISVVSLATHGGRKQILSGGATWTTLVLQAIRIPARKFVWSLITFTNNLPKKVGKPAPPIPRSYPHATE